MKKLLRTLSGSILIMLSIYTSSTFAACTLSMDQSRCDNNQTCEVAGGCSCCLNGGQGNSCFSYGNISSWALCTRSNYTTNLTMDADTTAISGSTVRVRVVLQNFAGDKYFAFQYPYTAAYGLVFAQSSVAPTFPANPLNPYPIFAILSGETKTIDIDLYTYTNNRSLPQLVLTGEVLYDNPLNPSGLRFSQLSLINPIPKLIINQTLQWTNPSFSGDQISYHMTIQNQWSLLATGITFYDNMALNVLGLPTVNFGAATYGYNGFQLPSTLFRTGNYLDIGPGQTVDILLNAKVRGTFPVGTPIPNTWRIVSTNPLYTGSLMTSSVMWSIAPYSDLTIQNAQTWSAVPLLSGDAVAFTLAYKYLLWNVNLTWVNMNVSISGTNISWTNYALPNISQGGTGSFTLTGIVNKNYAAGTQICLNATIASAQNDNITGNNTISNVCYTIGNVADLMITNQISPTINVANLSSGSAISYILSITNTGTATATWVIVTDVLPNNVTYVSSSQTNSTASNNTISWAWITVNPGQTIQITINWIINNYPANGVTLITTWTVTTASIEGNFTNNSFVLSTSLSGLADLYVTQTMLPISDSRAGAPVTFIINYGNNGGKTASGVTITDTSSPSISLSTSTQNIWNLTPGQGGTITLTGTLSQNVQAGQILTNTALISSTTPEVSLTNNVSTVTGVVPEFDNIFLDIKANNITKPRLNLNPYNEQNLVGAISWDVIRISIAYTNSGNLPGTAAMISLAWTNGFTSMTSFNSNLWTLAPDQNWILIITWIVGPKNFISFTPLATLTYNSNRTKSDTLTIQEPMVCGDGYITKTEECDTATGVLAPGQVCENQQGSCVLVTKLIVNNACITYGTEKKCSSISSDLLASTPPASTGQCNLRALDGNLIITEEDNNWDEVWYARVTCELPNNAIGDIQISCDNWNNWSSTINGNHAERVCNYPYDNNNNNHTIQCRTNNVTCDTENILVSQWSLGRCGDNTVNYWEDCDDGNQNGNNGSCSSSCRWENKESKTPACFYINNKNISIQENEWLPFRWKLDNKKNPVVRDESACTRTRQWSIKNVRCTFVLSNWENKDINLDMNNVDCNDKASGAMFKYFSDSTKNAFGIFAKKIDNNITEGRYGEYKLTLKKVTYDYCDNGDWEKEISIDRVCEVDFAVTKPYLVQKSAFWLTPKAANIDLDPYYDIHGEKLLKSTDLDKIMVLDGDTYSWGNKVKAIMVAFISKYNKLGIELSQDQKTEMQKSIKISSDGKIDMIKKVPSQNILIFKWEGTITFNGSSDVPVTVITQWFNVVIKGDVTTNAMFLVNGGNILFDEPDNKCTKNQEVRGIFITDKSFASPKLINNNLEKPRCNFGGLYVKGVLIGKGIDQLVKDRRSQLNSRFYLTSDNENKIQAQRRNKIFNGAAVMIEYSPSLREKLPPGANEFTKALDVYKK